MSHETDPVTAEAAAFWSRFEPTYVGELEDETGRLALRRCEQQGHKHGYAPCQESRAAVAPLWDGNDDAGWLDDNYPWDWDTTTNPRQVA